MTNFFNLRKTRIIFVVTASLFFFSLVYIYYKIYNQYHIGIPCIFFKVTGLLCPGCGITRAIFALLNFDILSAMHYNLLAVLLLPIILIYYILRIINWINFKVFSSKIFTTNFWYLLLFILVIFLIFSILFF